MRLFALECRTALGHFLSLSFGALFFQMRAAKLFAQIAQRALAFFDIGASSAETGADLFLVLRVNAQGFLGGAECGLKLGELRRSPFQLATDAAGQCITFAAL